MTGRRYQFFVEATDAVGNVSDWVPGVPFTVKTAQETSVAIHYSGPWSRAHPTGAYGRATMRTFKPGASATYRFIGRSVAFIARSVRLVERWSSTWTANTKRRSLSTTSSPRRE